MSFVAVSRLRISIWIKPIAMGMLVLFELLGSKYIWWTWHDTDPLLKDRWLGIPFHVMYHHFCFASGFMTIHLILKKYFLFGEYYEQEHYKREWFYVFLLAIGAQLIGFLFMALIYDLWTHFFQIEVTICFVLLMSFSIFFIWIEDREKKKHLIENLPPIDAYDSDWLYPSVDHAINQMLFVYLIFQIIMILFIDPSNLVSVGHHQPLGDCLLEEEYHSNVFLYWTKQKRNKFLCVEEFEEEFNLCNYPLTQVQVSITIAYYFYYY
jgi:hypothetical protein